MKKKSLGCDEPYRCRLHKKQNKKHVDHIGVVYAKNKTRYMTDYLGVVYVKNKTRDTTDRISVIYVGRQNERT